MALNGFRSGLAQGKEAGSILKQGNRLFRELVGGFGDEKALGGAGLNSRCAEGGGDDRTTAGEGFQKFSSNAFPGADGPDHSGCTLIQRDQAGNGIAEFDGGII